LRTILCILALLAAPIIGRCEPVKTQDAGTTVTIRITQHGIPHILATNYFGLGYGYGYAMAKTDLCGLAEAFVTFNGTRAADFGETEMDPIGFLGDPIDNVASDQVMRLIVDDDRVDAQIRALPNDLRKLVDGYAQGYNFYIASEARLAAPRACRNAVWVRPITSKDIVRRVAALALSLGVVHQHGPILEASPPPSLDRKTQDTHLDLMHPDAYPSRPAKSAIAARSTRGPTGLGSNGFAAGRDLTDNGSGLLFANPHWFWAGPNRFVEVHLTIPNELDVMGASLLAMPVITIGFNHSVAWTHTSTTDAKATVFRLRLSPHDPSHYLVDGKSIPMQQKLITVIAKGADGKTRRRTRGFWMTEYGPIIKSAQFPWDRTFAFAFADPNEGNYRMIQQWFAFAKSRDVEEIKDSLTRILGLPWTNTMAADASGQVLYADMTVAPGVEADKFNRCKPSGMPLIAPSWKSGFNVMDGSQSACQWSTYSSAPQAGILPAERRPWLIRTDYVANSNYSHWTSNAKQLLTGFSPIVGPEGEPISFRTQTGVAQVEDRLAGRDGLPGTRFTQRSIEQIHDSGRDLFAEAVVGDLVAACKKSPQAVTKLGHRYDLSRVCTILERWDRHADIQSVGYPIFREFTVRVSEDEDAVADPRIWRVPFDPANPFHTPRKLNTDNPNVLKALASAAEYLEQQGIPLDAPWGESQFVVRNGKKLPIHGGYFLWDNIVFPLKPHVGYTDAPELMNGNSYEQAVTFTKDGPVADAVLASSQAPDDVDSPYYADQTEMYSRKEWMRLPFSSDDIAKELVSPPIVLKVPGSTSDANH
jgi:acyl-homoserine-lactone acylase